jgi:hypothetical protein
MPPHIHVLLCNLPFWRPVSARPHNVHERGAKLFDSGIVIARATRSSEERAMDGARACEWGMHRIDSSLPR